MAAVLLLTGCGGSSPSAVLPKSSEQIAEGAHRALSGWRGFPVNAQPRAVVMLGGRVQRPPAQSGTETHLLQAGSYHVPATLSRAPQRRGGYRLLSANQAAHKLRILKPAKAARRPRLVVVRARLNVGRFPTDRPDTTYPAWLFYVRGANTPTRVLAATVFRPPAPIDRRAVPPALAYTPVADSAVVSRNGRDLIINFAGASPGKAACDINYTAQTFSSRTAVAYAIVPHPVPTHRKICPLGAYEQSINVTLKEPLGRRVLIGANYGNAVPVINHRCASSADSPRALSLPLFDCDQGPT